MAESIRAGSGFNYVRLRQWREESRLRMEEVCARAGISYPYLRSLESGRQDNPSIEIVVRLAMAYGRDARELLTDTRAVS